MKREEFKISIDATPEKVWNLLWNDATYPEWTSVFSEGSRAETDWKKGSKVIFLNADNKGMVSTIAENIPNKFMSIKHLGNFNNGVEDYDSEEIKGWSGALENYTLQSAEGKTELIVDMDIPEDYREMLTTAWPKALDKVKELAERNN